MLTKPRLAVALLTLLTLPACAGHADQPGRHPYYLHALADLRTARWLIEHRPGDTAVATHEAEAIGAIDAALREVKEAAIWDGKDVRDHVAVDAPPDYSGRLHQALDLLRKVHHDVDREEDDPAARGLKNRALGHIDAAAHQTEAAIWDVEHRR
jgi:hypothetical protein